MPAAEQALPSVQTHKEEWIAAAKRLFDKGEVAKAKLLLDTTIQAHKSSVDAYFLRTKACLQLGQAQEALQAARLGLEQAEACGSAEDQQRMRLAVAIALGHVARTPVMAQPQRSSHRAEARGLLEACLQAAPPPYTRYNLALILAEGGHYDAAVEAARGALGDGPKRGAQAAAPLALLALVLSARQQLPGALQLADSGLSALSSQPTPERGGSDAIFVEVLLLRIKAHILLANADTNGALTLMGGAKRRLTGAREAAASGALAAPFRRQEAQVWRELAAAYAGQAQVQDAAFCVAQAQQLEPSSAATLHAQGLVAEAGGDVRQALASYHTALAVDSTHAPTLLSLGTLLRRQARATDLSVAASLLTDALRYEPHNHVGWYNLGLVRKAQGHRQAAEEHLFSAVQLAASAPVLSYSQVPLLLC